MFRIIVAVAVVCVAGQIGNAAVITSTQNRTRMVRADLDFELSNYKETVYASSEFRTPVGSATVSADTVANTAVLNNWALADHFIRDIKFVREYPEVVDTIIIPADFPNPERIEYVFDIWRQELIVDRVFVAQQFIADNNPAPITPAMPPTFEFQTDAMIVLPEVTITGVFNVISPNMQVSQPFSITLTPIVAEHRISGRLYNIRQSSFDFSLDNGRTAYSIDDPLIFDGMVDGRHFKAELMPFTTDNLMPEPSTWALGIVGIGCLTYFRYRR